MKTQNDGRKHIERPFELKDTRIRKDGDETYGIFEGYASVFGEVDSYRDIVMPGAFLKSLESRYTSKNRRVPMLWQHNSWAPIGNYSTVEEDEKGLRVVGECNLDVQQGRECFKLMKQGALSGLSIGYNTRDDEWDENGVLRRLKEVDLWEISPVTFPAGDSARVDTVKSFADLMTLSDCEKSLRDAGYTKSEAATLVSRIKAIATRSDSVDDAAFKKLRDRIQSINK